MEDVQYKQNSACDVHRLSNGSGSITRKTHIKYNVPVRDISIKRPYSRGTAVAERQSTYRRGG